MGSLPNLLPCFPSAEDFSDTPAAWRLRNGTLYLAFNFHADVVGTVLQWMLGGKQSHCAAFAANSEVS